MLREPQALRRSTAAHRGIEMDSMAIATVSLVSRIAERRGGLHMAGAGTVKRWSIRIGLALLAVDILLLISGYRVLVWQARGYEGVMSVKIANPDEPPQETLDCTYFTGRSFQTVHFSGFDSKPDECPFVFRPRYLG
jgi:hypothetical protein